MTNPPYFTPAENRSERAKQVMLLVPALQDRDARFRFLGSIDTHEATHISKSESDQAKVMHFVWVVRDMFTHERDEASKTRSWASLRTRWIEVMALPEWASDPRWWRHPLGAHEGDKDFVVHPCHRSIGWTSKAIRERIRNLDIGAVSEEQVDFLARARKVMNTECDCFIQTPLRLIIVECKDKTSFSAEQRDRQLELSGWLKVMLDRSRPTIRVELSAAPSDSDVINQWTWSDVNNALDNGSSS